MNAFIRHKTKQKTDEKVKKKADVWDFQMVLGSYSLYVGKPKFNWR